jgi:hypothetical protein
MHALYPLTMRTMWICRYLDSPYAVPSNDCIASSCGSFQTSAVPSNDCIASSFLSFNYSVPISKPPKIDVPSVRPCRHEQSQSMPHVRLFLLVAACVISCSALSGMSDSCWNVYNMCSLWLCLMTVNVLCLLTAEHGHFNKPMSSSCDHAPPNTQYPLCLLASPIQ